MNSAHIQVICGFCISKTRLELDLGVSCQPALWIIPQGSLLATAGKVTLDSADNNILEVQHMQNKQLKEV